MKSKEKNSKMNKQTKTMLVILIVISTILMLAFFKNNIIAYSKGVDVKYIENKTYCEQHSDCVPQGDFCGEIVNIYNFEKSSVQCDLAIPETKCINKKCISKTIYGDEKK